MFLVRDLILINFQKNLISIFSTYVHTRTHAHAQELVENVNATSAKGKNTSRSLSKKVKPTIIIIVPKGQSNLKYVAFSVFFFLFRV